MKRKLRQLFTKEKNRRKKLSLEDLVSIATHLNKDDQVVISVCDFECLPDLEEGVKSNNQHYIMLKHDSMEYGFNHGEWSHTFANRTESKFYFNPHLTEDVKYIIKDCYAVLKDLYVDNLNKPHPLYIGA